VQQVRARQHQAFPRAQEHIDELVGTWDETAFADQATLRAVPTTPIDDLAILGLILRETLDRRVLVGL